MARIHNKQPLLLTIVDRLVDDGTVNPDAPLRFHRDLQESVRRDLENLLNAHRRPVSWPAELDELERSLVNYGIPDFTETNANDSQDVQRFVRAIEDVVREFEPRFQSVKVKVLKNEQEEDRVLRFRIDGTLYADPSPEPVVFDTALEPATGSIEVKSR